MLKLKTSELNTDMVIARDVTDLNGRVLANAGATITSRHMRIFKIWGIPEVCIKSGLESEVKEIEFKETEQLEAIKNKLKKNFLHNDLKHPFFRELFDICIQRQLAIDSSKKEK